MTGIKGLQILPAAETDLRRLTFARFYWFAPPSLAAKVQLAIHVISRQVPGEASATLHARRRPCQSLTDAHSPLHFFHSACPVAIPLARPFKSRLSLITPGTFGRRPFPSKTARPVIHHSIITCSSFTTLHTPLRHGTTRESEPTKQRQRGWGRRGWTRSHHRAVSSPKPMAPCLSS